MNFTDISSKEELADFLNITIKQLDYNAYNTSQKYSSFKIPKKSGGEREILAPIPSLKTIQKKLSKEFNKLYHVKPHVHSYTKRKGIRTNGKKHVNQRFILNVDLENFFPSINFGRVAGVFKSYPFNFNDAISYLLAQICCHENSLPQGSPSSPIISNFICRSLDNSLSQFARKNKCFYSRYSDDLTFSTNLYNFPAGIASIKNGKTKLGVEFIQIVEENGFEINPNKSSLRRKHEQQFVTGLIVNERLNVKRKLLRQVRAMLHSWEKYGLQKASKEHFKKYSTKHKNKKDHSLFIRIIEGKLLFIADIRGKEDYLFLSLLNKFKNLSPTIKLENFLSHQGEKIKVFTEGNTDWMHLKNALNSFNALGKYQSLDKAIEIIEYNDNHTLGDIKLKGFLEGYLASAQKVPLIAIFDSDNIQSLGEFKPKKKAKYYCYNDCVYTFFLPRPAHRKTNKNCIEHYYSDKDLRIEDEFGRRLYLSNEFDAQSGYLKENTFIRCSQSQKKLGLIEQIIDSEVRDNDENSLALSKKDYARYVLNKKEAYKRVKIDSFKLIFDIIRDIIKEINEKK